MIKITKKLPDFSRGTKILHNGTLKDLQPEQLLSQFLCKCKDIIENSRYSPQLPYPVGITIPSHFDHAMRSIYANAISLVPEFSLQAIVNENTALAVAYGVEGLNILENPVSPQYVLFVDSGCQTTVTLVYYNNSEIQVLYSAHNPVISGDTVNDIIYTEILNQLKSEHKIITPSLKQKLQLLSYVEQIKIYLNTEGNTSITIVLDKVDKMEPYTLRFTREKLNRAIEDTHMEEFLIELMNSVLANSGIKEFSKNKLSKIVLFGGNMNIYFLINSIRSSFKCHVETDWNNPNRISEGLMYFIFSRSFLQVYELLHQPSVFDMAKFNCDYLKVSQYVKYYQFEDELRKKNINKVTKKGGSVGVTTYAKTPGARNFYSPKLVERLNDSSSNTKITQSKVVTVDDEYSEDFINTIQEKLDKLKQKQNEKIQELTKQEQCSDVLQRLLNKKNRVCPKFEIPKKKDPNSPFLFDSVFAESYKDETELSKYLTFKGEVYEQTEEYSNVHPKKNKLTNAGNSISFQSNIHNKISEINYDSSKSSIKQKINESLDQTFQIKPPPSIRRMKINQKSSSADNSPQRKAQNYSTNNKNNRKDNNRRTRNE